MKLRTPHWIGIGLLVVGLVVVLIVQLTGIGRTDGPKFGPRTVVEGVVGSEKVAFFNDPQVQQVFGEHGYDVRVSKSGSWRMAELDGLTDYDFAFPASEIAATNISQTHPDAVNSTHKPFFSPMAIATFTPVLTVLEASGIASKDASGRWQIDIEKYLELVEDDTRWRELPGAAENYNSPRTVLITSTDIRTSNSAGMYLALASYVLNDHRVVANRAEADAHLELLTKLFVAQGYSGSTSTAPFDDYLSQGMGAVPMVMVYEGQFLEAQLAEPSRVTDAMELAYPSPTIFSVHTGVTFSDDGRAVMELLETDPKLAELLAAHGFRPQGANAATFDSFLADRDLADTYPSSTSFVNLAQEPSYESLDYLLGRISEAYRVSGAPPVDPGETELSQVTPDSASPNEAPAARRENDQPTEEQPSHDAPTGGTP